MKSIILSTKMVRAILEGRKTQIRQIVKPQPLRDEEWGIRCPYEPGDSLWVQETWGKGKMLGNGYRYKADLFSNKESCIWISPIFMPKKAARIFLQVTKIRIERLQDITEDDARAEGIKDGGCLNCGNNEPCGCETPSPSAIDSFIML